MENWLYIFFNEITIISFFIVFFLRKIKQLQLFFIAMIFLSILTVLHYYVSILIGREGYSIFTKKILKDEVLYFYNIKYLFKHNFIFDLDSLSKFQINLVGYSSIKSIFFSYLMVPFVLLYGWKLISLKGVIIIFSSLVIVILYNIFKIFNIKNSFLYALLILFYPNFLIHSIQIEKDTFLLFLVLFAIYILWYDFFIKKSNRTLFFYFFIVILVSFFRPQFGFILLIMYFSAKISQTSIIFYPKLMIIIIILIFPLFILFLKYFVPPLFAFIDAAKNYSVFAGHIGFLHHNYNDYINILLTILISLYYFLFAPLSSYIINANIFWKLLLIEPIFFLYFILYIFLFYKDLPKNVKQIVFTILVSSITYSCISVAFETQVSAYLRKRMIVYILIYIAFILTRIYKNRRRTYEYITSGV